MRALLLLPLLLVGAAPAPVDQAARLHNAKAASLAAERRAAQLQRAAEAENDEAAKARVQEAVVVERIKAAEADTIAARARLALADARLEDQHVRLAERQAPVERLVAALQSLARRPAAVALVQPGSANDIVHVRAVLGTMLPIVRARTVGVRRNIAEARRLRGQAAIAAASVRDGNARLQSERLALVRMEGEHRLRSRDLGRSALVESDRAIALGERARDIVDQMDQTTAATEIGAALATLPGPLPRPAQPGDAPLTRFTLPPYRLPVGGRVVEGLGEISPAGVRSRGVAIAAPRAAPVVAPADGRIVFARPFRGYGNVVIIDHGRGWTSAITGLGAVSVKRGDAIAAGTVLGQVPTGGDTRISVELRRRGVPVDLAQLIS